MSKNREEFSTKVSIKAPPEEQQAQSSGHHQSGADPNRLSLTETTPGHSVSLVIKPARSGSDIDKRPVVRPGDPMTPGHRESAKQNKGSFATSNVSNSSSSRAPSMMSGPRKSSSMLFRVMKEKEPISLTREIFFGARIKLRSELESHEDRVSNLLQNQYGFYQQQRQSLHYLDRHVNRITTHKYHAFSFIPSNLYDQFHRVANMWFLFVSVMQLLPKDLSPTSSWATVVPLSIVLIVTMIKDGVEDYKRYQSDVMVNAYPVEVITREARIKSDDDGSMTPPASDMMTSKYEMIGSSQQCRWEDVKPGDILVLAAGDSVPADCVLLNSNEDGGVCYVETSQLDGETHLKLKQPISPDSRDSWMSVSDISKRCYGKFVTDQPNKNLNNLQFSVGLEDGLKLMSGDKKSVLLRGSKVSHVEWCYVAVLFAGEETKLAMNAASAPLKRSRIEIQINKYLVMIFAVLGIAAISSLVSKSTVSHYETEFYTGYETTTLDLWSFITFVILYNNLVPISLYVTVDIVRVLQAYFIKQDTQMWHCSKRHGGRGDIDETNIVDNCLINGECIHKTEARNTCITDDLGQVNYLFSDKTGTITENEMQFRKCSIFGTCYGGHTSTNKSSGSMKDSASIGTPKFKRSYSISEKIRRTFSSYSAENSSFEDPLAYVHSRCSFHDSVLERTLSKFHRSSSSLESPARPSTLTPSSESPASQFREKDTSFHRDESSHSSRENRAGRISDFLYCASMCNTVIPTTDTKSGQVIFQSSSPDEEALVIWASKLGYTLNSRNVRQFGLSFNNQKESDEFTILGIHEFSSERKKMSIVLQRFGEVTSTLYCKGADNAIETRLRVYKNNLGEGQTNNEQEFNHQEESEILKQSMSHVKDFAKDGLRTLFLAKREFSEDETMQYMDLYKNASTAIMDRDEKLNELADIVEDNLTLLGVSGIEDKIQVGVAKTFERIINSGIKTWVLTGDKRETAINIAYGAGLLHNNMHIHDIRLRSQKHLRKGMSSLSLSRLVTPSLSSIASPLSMLADTSKRSFQIPTDISKRSFQIPTDISKMPESRSQELNNPNKLLSPRSYQKASSDAPVDIIRQSLSPIPLATPNASSETNTHLSDEMLCLNVAGSLTKLKRDFETIQLQMQSRQWVNKNIDQYHIIEKARQKRVMQKSIKTSDVMKAYSDRVDMPPSSSLEAPRFNYLASNTSSNHSFMNDSADEDEDEKKFDEQALKEYLDNLPDPAIATIIDGQSLSLIMESLDYQEMFLQMASKSKVVIACRIAPAQKGALVSLVRFGLDPKPVTLAIGDGGNDVPMLQRAHIGVGVMGNEGMQAVRASDFAISQFRFLSRLLFVHGRRNYNRIAIVVLFSFFKNICLIIPNFFFIFYNGYSGASLYDSWVLMSYNVFWTSIPIFIIGVTEQDVDDSLCLQIPSLYSQGLLGKSFNKGVFAIWMLKGILYAAVTYFTIVLSFQNYASNLDGKVIDHVVLGTLSYFCTVCVVNIKLAIEVKYLNKLLTVSIILSIMLFIPFISVYSKLGYPSSAMEGVSKFMFTNPLTWSIVFLISIFVFMFELGIKYVCRVIYPNPVDIIYVASMHIRAAFDQFALDKEREGLTEQIQMRFKELKKRATKLCSLKINPAQMQQYKIVVKDINVVTEDVGLFSALVPSHRLSFFKALQRAISSLPDFFFGIKSSSKAQNVTGEGSIDDRINRFTLRFNNKNEESMFQKFFFKRSVSTLRMILSLFGFLFFGWALYELLTSGVSCDVTIRFMIPVFILAFYCGTFSKKFAEHFLISFIFCFIFF